MRRWVANLIIVISYIVFAIFLTGLIFQFILYTLYPVDLTMDIIFILLGVTGLIYGVKKHYETINIKFSPLWYLLPIFFSIIGSLIVYLVMKNRKPDVGRALAMLGLAVFVGDVAVGVIMTIVMLFTFVTFLKSETLGVNGEKTLGTQRIIYECSALCSEIKNASEDDFYVRVWNYCKASFPIQKQEGFGDIIYKGPAGAESYCRTNAHCFNIEGAECYAKGQKIGPEICIEMMCKSLVEEGMNVREASDFIRKTMANSGSCGLRKGVTVKTKNGQEVIGVPTRWEKYFENPDCSKYVG